MKFLSFFPKSLKLLSLLFLFTLSFTNLHAAYYYLDSNYGDAEEIIATGTMYRTSVDMDIAYDTYGAPDRGLEYIGLKFNNVNIPVGSTITSAKIRFRAYGSNSSAASLIITGELTNDATNFGSTANNISSRSATSASVAWNPGSWTQYNYYETSDITSIIQEIVNQAGYAEDDLAIFIKPGAGCSDSDCARRAYSRDASSYSAARLEVTYTIPPPSCATLRDSKDLTAADNSYTNAAYYNWSTWNVGPSASSMNRAYKFHVDSAGNVSVDLTRVDQYQAKFSISKDACPTTYANLDSSELTLDSAGDFYVYIYYVDGSHSNIEHQLDVIFTATVPPVIESQTFSVSENASIGDIVDTVSSTGEPTSYSINSGNDDGKFQIDNNGTISVIGTLDYETTTQYTLEITATNSIGDDDALITINVIDESAPVAYDQTFNIDETALNDDFVGTIVSTGNPNNFSITSGNGDNVFKLDSSGTIEVNDNTNLDADITPQYILLVHLSSSEGSTDINVTINVDSTLPTGDDNRRDFTNVSLFGSDSISINGNILLIGNQLICKSGGHGETCTAPTVGATNNSVYQYRAKIDTTDGAPDSNSWAKLTLEDGTTNLLEADEVIFARLYWSARIDESTVDEAEKNEARTIQIKGPSSSTYTTLTSPVNRFNWFKSGDVFDYSASQDVTAYVKSNGAGNYSVGGIKSSYGNNMFASWALVVIVQNPQRELNNLSIYDGFQAIYDGGSPYPQSVTVPASGFLTPLGTEPFKASLFVYTGESESGLDDTAEIQNSAGTYNHLTDGYNTDDDVFNASIYTPEDGFRSDHVGEADPNFKNVVGTDIDKLEVNRDGDSSKQFLSNAQTSTNIRIASGGDRYTLNMFAFETELHYPKMCYDYSYSQDGFIYTELNDGTQYPYVDIPTNSGNPITVTIYIRSEDNDVDFDHVSIYSDNNLSLLSYGGEFQRTNVNSFGYTAVESEQTSPSCLESDSSSNICKTTLPEGNFRVGVGRPDATGHIGYPLMDSGSMKNHDFMYFKYILNPIDSSPLKTPLKLFSDIQYSLTSGGVSVDPVYDLPFGGDRMPLCPPSTTYVPEWGMFNVIDTQLNSTQTGQVGSRYYNNLLTQVPERPFSSDIVAYNPVTEPPNDPLDVNTSVAIELVDIKGFHDVNISCKEPAVSFSERIHINFADQNRSTISSLKTSYAKQDAAYRIWYVHDGNISNIIMNWASVNDSDGALIGINNLYEQIPDAPDFCWGECDGPQSPAITRTANCYECLRTYFGYPLCSRDNFAIRPESYHINLSDSNESSSLDITQNNSDTAVNLATGYNYRLDINSTNHLDNNNTIGYSKQFSEDITNSSVQLLWRDLGATCNDTSSPVHTVLMSSGGVSNFRFLNSEAGSYDLKILDSEWTIIDQGQPIHHVTNEYWITNKDDCIIDSSVVFDTVATSANRPVGCNISSTHTVDRSVTGLIPLSYYDLDITYKPYSLNIDNIVVSYGTDFNTNFASSSPFSYIYMSDISQNSSENNMSLNIVGNINAQGKDGIKVTNFTNSCYAEDLSIELDTVLPAADLNRFTYRYIYLDSFSDAVFSDTNDTNTTFSAVNIFQNDENGTSSLRLHYNYDRNITTALNPKQLNLSAFNVDCVSSADCTMIADQNSLYDNNSSLRIDQNLSFYYGRTHAPRQRFTSPKGTAGDPAIDFIYYEVYCEGSGCDRNILQDGSTSNISDDPRWYINTQHSTVYGTAGVINQKAYTPTTGYVKGTATSGNHQDSTSLVYDGTRGYTYKATMENTPSAWLIYNKNNIADTTNEFKVEFSDSSSSWAGVRNEDATTTDRKGTDNVNRRSMW